MLQLLAETDYVTGLWSPLLSGLFGGLIVAILSWILSEKTRLKTQAYQLKAFQFQTKFSHLHERQAIILARIYRRVADLQMYVEWYTSVGEQDAPADAQAEKERRWEDAREKNRALRRFVELNAVYLSDEIKDATEEAVKKLAAITAGYHSRARREATTHIASLDPKEDSYIRAFHDLEEIAKPLLQKLRKAFQKELGMEPPK